ncbi:MAG: TerC family protein [Deltaproteobacteria bacterium]|nr:TerC family protein [Deltaproteobacteria bacterium]
MIWMWIGFVAFVLAMLALDLGVFHRTAHVVKVKEALGWSAMWITLGLSFSVFIYFGYENRWLGLGTAFDQMAVSATNPEGLNDGTQATIKYLTGYLIEKSLSVDNIFVIAMLFGFFAVPAIYQHRVLFWGIMGALVMRGAMIGVGAALLREFAWIIYIFGGFLILTAVKMLLLKDDETDPGNNAIVKLTRKLFRVTERYHGQHFFVRAGSDESRAGATSGTDRVQDGVVAAATPGTLLATPLFLALVMVEFTDVIFAVDSIPAIFAVTTDPFLVFTSNVFAILGLRSLYFALAGMIDSFRYLKPALAVVLMVVGVKMLAHTWLKALLGEHFNLYVLAAVLGILALGVVASIWHREHDEHVQQPGGEGSGRARVAD